MSGCVTTVKNQNKIILPPRPAGRELDEPTNVKELVQCLNYYETQMKLWENWANDVEHIVEVYNESDGNKTEIQWVSIPYEKLQ